MYEYYLYVILEIFLVVKFLFNFTYITYSNMVHRYRKQGSLNLVQFGHRVEIRITVQGRVLEKIQSVVGKKKLKLDFFTFTP